ncbi:MAG TPA: hypothetical protein VF613_06775 [Longimicrobium sp.]|jgi:hypothetical protein
MSRARTTRDPIEIRLWVEEHGGAPVVDGALRIDFGRAVRPAEAVWVRWFAAFETLGLALRYLPEGGSRCHELVRGPADDERHGALPRPARVRPARMRPVAYLRLADR